MDFFELKVNNIDIYIKAYLNQLNISYIIIIYSNSLFFFINSVNSIVIIKYSIINL